MNESQYRNSKLLGFRLAKKVGSMGTITGEYDPKTQLWVGLDNTSLANMTKTSSNPKQTHNTFDTDLGIAGTKQDDAPFTDPDYVWESGDDC